MKKVKFTLGLALSLLFVGANVADAQQEKGFKSGVRTVSEIKETFSFKTNPNYETIDSDTTMRFGQNGGIYNTTSGFSLGTNIPNLHKKDTLIKKTVYDYQNIFDNQADILYYGLKQNFKINFKYKEGKDLRPLVRMKITLGEWFYEYKYDGETKIDSNVVRPTEIYINDYLVPTNVESVTSFDRKSEVATYEYSIDIMELLAKYPVYAIDFEISLNDEIGIVGSDPDGPQLGSLPENMRMITVNAGQGVKANISMDGSNVFYVPSYKTYTFTVESDKDIKVTCDRNADPEYGIVITKASKNVYNVTIKQIRSNCTITIEQKTETAGGIGEDGQTGNDLFDDYAVWGANGTLYVKAASTATLSIYNITGQLCNQTTVNGSTSFPLAKGLYIVQLNGKAYKVVL